MEDFEPLKNDYSNPTSTTSPKRPKKLKRKRRRLADIGERLLHSATRSPELITVRQNQEPDHLRKRFEEIVGKSNNLLAIKRTTLEKERRLKNYQIQQISSMNEKRAKILERIQN